MRFAPFLPAALDRHASERERRLAWRRLHARPDAPPLPPLPPRSSRRGPFFVILRLISFRTRRTRLRRAGP